jgi:DNA-binding GntR family transcriptional regulator
MTNVKKKTTIELTAERLREIVLAADEDTLIGSEESLVTELGCSRSTVRQVARLLEREGLLRVKRGINGGYFGTRPDTGTIEAIVGTYLSTLDLDAQDVTLLASALWVEVMRKAAGHPDRDVARTVSEQMERRIRRVKEGASFQSIRDLELEMQDAVFEFTKSHYVKLIFDINAEFSRRKFDMPIESDDGAVHQDFVRAWRDAKLLELKAIAEGDRDLAVMAARYSRKIWHRRVYTRLAPFAHGHQVPPPPERSPVR